MPRNHGRWMLLALASLLIAASCVESAPAGPAVSLVPDDAIVAVFVDSPYKLYAAVEGLWDKAGLAETLGVDFEGLLSKGGLPVSEEDIKLLDFARPWAFALIPASPGSSETRSVLYVPFKGQSAAALEKLGGDSMRLVAQAKGYLALATGEGQLAIPPAKSLDVSRLARYPAASIKAWADPGAVRRLTKNGFKPIEGAARRFVTGEATGTEAAAAAIEDAALSLLAELRCADAAIAPGPAGLSISVGAVARPAGFLERAFARAAAAPSALDWAAQVDADALYGYAWSCDPDFAAELSMKVAKPLLAGLGVPADLVAGLARIEERWASAAGARGTASFDIEMDLSALKDQAGQDPTGMVAAIEKAFDFDFEAVQEVRDDARYRDLMRSLASDPDFKALSSIYADKLGVEFSLESRDRSDGAFRYGEMTPVVKVADPAKLGSGEEAASAAAAIDAVMGKLRLAWAVSGGRIAMTTGGPGELKELVSRKAAARPLSSDPAFAAFAGTLPPKPLFVGSFSSRRLVEIVREAMADAALPDAGIASALDPARFGAWYSYAAVDGTPGSSYVEAGLRVPAGDIGALAALGASFAAKKPADAEPEEM